MNNIKASAENYTSRGIVLYILSVINRINKAEFKPQSITELITELHSVANKKQMHLFKPFQVYIQRADAAKASRQLS